MSDKKHHEYLRYASLGVQMVVYIGVFVAGGYFLDKHFQPEKPWFTLGLSLVGVIFAMIYFIRQVSRGNKK